MAMPLRLPNGDMVPTSTVIQQASRQVGRKSEHFITLSALRTLAVTTILGRSGLQYGAKPIPMPDGVDFEVLRDEVGKLVHAILERFAGAFADKEHTLIGAPSVMAGLGIAANRAVTSLPNSSGKPRLTSEELLSMLGDIRWEKEGFWDGVATRKTPSGKTTVAGPKEVGYAVADAIDGTNPVTGAQIRGRVAAEAPEPLQPALS
jgi:DNA sulfur modification protein DndB